MTNNMITLVKHEWHQVDRQLAYELTAETLAEIYPDMSKRELKKLFKQIETGEVSVDEILDDARDNDIEINWEPQYEDCYTDRKGGYDVTYELGDESSWHYEPPPSEHTHKCSKCKWTGEKWDGDWKWEDENGNTLEDAEKICPYCESAVVLTEYGAQQEHISQIEEIEDDTIPKSVRSFDKAESSADKDLIAGGDGENEGEVPSDEEMAEEIAILDSLDKNEQK